MSSEKWKCWSLSRVQLCDPLDCSPTGSSVQGTLQARMLEWAAISFFKRSSQPSDQTGVSCIVGRFFTVWATLESQGCLCLRIEELSLLFKELQWRQRWDGKTRAGVQTSLLSFSWGIHPSIFKTSLKFSTVCLKIPFFSCVQFVTQLSGNIEDKVYGWRRFFFFYWSFILRRICMQWKPSEERWHQDEAIKSTFKDSERYKAVDSRIKLKLTNGLLRIISALHYKCLTQRPHIKECLRKIYGWSFWSTV